MNLDAMKYNLSILVIYICISLCSTDKLEQEKKVQHVHKKEKEKEIVEEKPKFEPRKFKSREEIPEDYLDFLKKTYNVQEDPLKVKEDWLRANGLLPDNKLDYDDLYPDPDPVEQGNGTDIEEDLMSLENNETYTQQNETCSVCALNELNKQRRLESIKNTILSSVGFTVNNLPNMTGKTIPKIPSILHLLDYHEMQADAPYSEDYYPEDDTEGQVKRAYIIAKTPPESFNINVPGGCFFDLGESVTSRKIQDASLWIHIKKTAPHKRTKPLEIHIYAIPQKAKPEHILKGPVRYKKTTSSGWMEFKFSHIVHHWIRQVNGNRGLVIQAFDEDGENLVITPDNNEDEDHFPMLEMSLTDHAHNRKKRSYPSNICTENEKIEGCCRYPLRVSFVQFGWDWVIAPTGYTANYCSGKCRFRHLENNPSAYILQQAPDGVGPCCTPSKYFPLAMLYFDHSDTILYTYMQKMIVERCGCA